MPKPSITAILLPLLLLPVLIVTSAPETVVETMQFHAVPQNYYLEQRLASTVLPSRKNNLSGVKGMFNITIQNSQDTGYVFNLLTFPSSSPTAVNAYQCYIRGATEGFKVHDCPFENITYSNGSCNICLQTAINNLNQTSACLGCNNLSNIMQIQLYQQGCTDNDNQQGCTLKDSDVLLIIDNTNVIWPAGGVYLEMLIGYSIQLQKFDYGFTMVFLWIIIIAVFIIITAALIIYISIKISKMEQDKKMKIQLKQQ